jgi:hypothetical protein
MKEERGRVPDLILEQYALGELPRKEEARLRSAMGSDQSLRRRLEEIERSNAEILADHPPERMAAQIRSRLEQGERDADRDSIGRFRPSPGARAAAVLARRAAIPAAAAFLALAGALAFRGGLGSPPSDLDDTRAKGDTAKGAAVYSAAAAAGLHVFRKTATGSEELPNGALAARRDLVQLSYSSGGARYGAILSIDGRGSVTFHLPLSYSGGSGESPALDGRPGTALGSAYELDDAPSFERFFIVLSEKPFALSEVYDDARKLASRPDAANAPLPLDSRLGQSSIILRKSGSAK